MIIFVCPFWQDHPLSEDMLNAIKARAEDEGLDYQKWIRSSLEDALNKSA